MPRRKQKSTKAMGGPISDIITNVISDIIGGRGKKKATRKTKSTGPVSPTMRKSYGMPRTKSTAKKNYKIPKISY